MRGLTLADTALVGRVASGFNPFGAGFPTWTHASWAGDPAWANPGDGGAVSSIRNNSGGGDPAQATVTAKPTYRASVAALGNRPALEFDGGDSLNFDVADINTPFYAIAVGALSGSGVARSLLGFSTTSGLRMGVTAGNLWIATAGTTLAGGTTDNNAHVLEAILNGASSSLYLDGTQIASGGGGNSALTRFVLGAANGSNWLGYGAFWGIVAGQTTRDATIVSSARAIGARYGITVA